MSIWNSMFKYTCLPKCLKLDLDVLFRHHLKTDNSKLFPGASICFLSPPKTLKMLYN